MKKIFILIGCAVLSAALVIAFFHSNSEAYDRGYHAGYEKSSATSDYVNLSSSQIHFAQSRQNEFVGINYLAAAIELSSHHASIAASSIDSELFDDAVTNYSTKYIESYNGGIVTSSGLERTVIGDSNKRSLKIYRHRDMPQAFEMGTTASVVIKALIEHTKKVCQKRK